MRWTVHGERTLYDSEWVRLTAVDVEVPGHGRFDHHVVRSPMDAAGTVVTDPERGVLLLWRHRFITDSWGWEIPAGRVDAGESPIDAAARETLEESGWEPSGLTHLTTYHPTIGLGDLSFHLYRADGARYVGEPSDPGEAERIAWVPIPELRTIAERGEMLDGLSLTAVLFALAFGRL